MSTSVQPAGRSELWGKLPLRAAPERLRGRVSREAGWLWLAVGVFVLVSAWWLTQDSRVPDFDSGFHLSTAYSDYFAISGGHLTQWFTEYTSYPPLIHLLGALTIGVVGMHPMALILEANIVFVPLLAFGCYGTGKIVAGPRAGLLAGVFALGTPMFVSMMHQYDLDPPQAALVAVSVWAILASRRFERLGISALAGGLCALALMTKQTSVVFLIGLIAVVIIRGGWRNWLGLIIFAFVLETVAGPWYFFHLPELVSSFGSIGGLAPSVSQAPPRFSTANAGWYFWDLVNQQTAAPLAAAFLAGTVIAIWRCIRSPVVRQGYLPELLAGGVVSYVAMTYLTHKDPRYTLPALVYVAVLGTFWIPGITQRVLRIGLTTAVLAVSVLNFAGMAFGIGGSARVMVSLPGATTSIIYPRHLTLYETTGWVRGEPRRNGDVLNLFKGLYRSGVRAIGLDPSASLLDFSNAGVLPLAEATTLYVQPAPAIQPHGAYLLIHQMRPGDPSPCQRLTGEVITGNAGVDYGIYVVSGSFAGLDAALLRNPAHPAQRYQFVCPRR